MNMKTSMQKCKRCNEEARGFVIFDYCPRCSRNLCDPCMSEGCCGHVPALSGMEVMDQERKVEIGIAMPPRLKSNIR